MSANSSYYQFPLCFLAYGPDAKNRLSVIVSWSCVRRGRQLTDEMDTEEKLEYVAEHTVSPLPSGLDKKKRSHLSLLAGMHTLGVHGGHAQTIINEAFCLDNFQDSFESKTGPSPLVRVRSDLLWDAIKDNRPYREFSVLAGVYCLIGNQDRPVRITRDRINAAALGYKSQKLLTPEILAMRQDKAAPLTTDKLRYTLDKLEADSLFMRVQLSPRRVYFSNRMTRDEMTEKLFAVATRRKAKLNGARKADKELQAKIRAAIIVGKPSKPSPRINHERPAMPPPIPHEVPTSIETTLKETALKETTLKETTSIALGGRPVVFSEHISETEHIQNLIRQAEEIGTPESLHQAEVYRPKLDSLLKGTP